MLDDLDRNQRSRLTVPMEDARLLRLLTESINAKHVVELGTANGYSGIWFALALQTTGGKLTTFEIDPDSVKQARENFKRAGVDHLISQVEGDAHQQVTKLTGPIVQEQHHERTHSDAALRLARIYWIAVSREIGTGLGYSLSPLPLLSSPLEEER